MRVRTPIDLGLAVRERRRALGLDQRKLAAKAGVSRQWIMDLERGRPGVGLRMVLQTLDQLDLRLSVDSGEPAAGSQPGTGLPTVDVDAVIRKARGEHA